MAEIIGVIAGGHWNQSPLAAGKAIAHRRQPHVGERFAELVEHPAGNRAAARERHVQFRDGLTFGDFDLRAAPAMLTDHGSDAFPQLNSSYFRAPS
jgi:hypothetical protein